MKLTLVLVLLSHMVAAALGSSKMSSSFRPKAFLMTGGSVAVHKDFLKPEEIAQLLKDIENVKLSSYSNGRLQGTMSGYTSIFVDRLKDQESHGNSKVCSDDKALPVSVLTKSTKPHQDRTHDTRELVDDSLVGYLVASVASKSLDPAYFHYNAEMHPLEPGSLFVFDGTSPHFTTIDEGTVTLVGPVRLDTFEPVGFGDTIDNDCQPGIFNIPTCNCDCEDGQECSCNSTTPIRRLQDDIIDFLLGIPIIGDIIEILFELGYSAAQLTDEIVDELSGEPLCAASAGPLAPKCGCFRSCCCGRG